MSLPIWGLLEKSVDNPQTIDQAIAAAIAVHESDPTSHLGAGESLQAHKNDSIIDHPAQSVVLDKTPYQDYQQFLNGIDQQGWSNEQGSWNSNQPTRVAAGLFSQNSFIGVGQNEHDDGDDYPDADLMYQFKLTMRHGGQTDGNLRFGFTNDLLDIGSRMIFVKDGITWKWQLYTSGTLMHTYSISTSNNLIKYYRIYFDSVNEEIVLYEGTTIISTYATADWKDFIFNNIAVDMNRTTNNQISWDLRGWKSTFALGIDI